MMGAMTALRQAVKDPNLRKVVKRLLSGNLVVEQPAFSPSSIAVSGTLDGEPFSITISGDAIKEFAFE
jgi:hypothetical protein